MIHEEQIRQLCAIHTVNNLLQLPDHLDYDSCINVVVGGEEGECNLEEDDDAPITNNNEKVIIHEWTCHGNILRRYTKCNKCQDDSALLETQIRVATQDEFDNIAKELTQREQMLLSGDESTFISATSTVSEENISSNNGTSSLQTSKQLHKVSMMQRVRSQYGTPYLGNYSIDVIQEALLHRGIELEFYRLREEEDDSINIHATKCSAEKGDANSTTRSSATTSKKCLLGLVIYVKEDDQQISSTLSYLSRIGSHIPIIKHFCSVGQHWYAITGVQYTSSHHDVGSVKVEDSSSKEYKQNENNDDSSWHVIDSKRDDIIELKSDKELVDYARDIQKGGGLVFRAFIDSSS